MEVLSMRELAVGHKEKEEDGEEEEGRGIECCTGLPPPVTQSSSSL